METVTSKTNEKSKEVQKTSIDHKYYRLDKDYTLRIELTENRISFKVTKLSDVMKYNYENRFDYQTLIKQLKISQYRFCDLKSIFVLLDKIYNKTKFKINIVDENTMNLSIEYKNIDGAEDSYELKLNKKYMSNDDKFNVLFQLYGSYDNSETGRLTKKIEELTDIINQKDNIINDINKKLHDLQKEVNDLKKMQFLSSNNQQIASSLPNNLNSSVNKSVLLKISELKAERELKRQVTRKEKNPKNISLLTDKSHQKNYTDKVNYQFTKDPQNLKFKKDIINSNTSSGWNDLFEVFLSYIDQKEYIASPNKDNYNIDIISLDDSKLITELKGHVNDVRTIRYFINKSFNEYLISADDDKLVIVWDVTNDYGALHLIETYYTDCIYSCLLLFDDIENKNYIITSSFYIDSDKEKASSKMYSLETGNFIKNINKTNKIGIFYLLPWLNKDENKYYVVQFGGKKIIVTDLEDKSYFELVNDPEENHYSGFIYTKDKTDYLCSSSAIGFINIWDLINKEIFKVIDTKNCKLTHLIQWNEKYGIVADYSNCSMKIIDIEKGEIVKDIGGQHKDKDNVKCVKKINSSTNGESLLSVGKEGIIKLWNV